MAGTCGSASGVITLPPLIKIAVLLTAFSFIRIVPA
jgi:hypothetical protein